MTMEEVRSYWQVASISHFCNLFGKPFKLPTFESEELEQAFILEIPAPAVNNNTNSLVNNVIKLEDKIEESPIDPDDPEWLAPGESSRSDSCVLNQNQNQSSPPENHQQELHLLVRLAISLLKPHFNCKISQNNWELYLCRLIDINWVELEHNPSPFRVPLVSQDGVELTKKLVFNELPLSDKIDLFYALCDYRLWCDDAADATKDYTLEELRLESVGKDSQGYEYWYFSGTRLFRENKELSHDIIIRKKRIKELEFGLVELEKDRILKEQEKKRKAELERARQLANEAREARQAAKHQQEQEATKKRKLAAPILPPRTGLRERRSSATSNNNDSQNSRTPTTRSKIAKQETGQSITQKSTRNTSKNSKNTNNADHDQNSPDLARKSEQETLDELNRLAITAEDRAEAWCIQCESLEEWEDFATKFEKSKSTNEKYLSAYINNELLPNIRTIYAKRAAEVRRKDRELVLSISSRRVSSRITSKKAQEEEERQAQMQKVEMRRKKIEAETRLRAELEREYRVKKSRFPIEEEANCPPDDNGEEHIGYRTRGQQHHNSDRFDGIIHPDNLSEFYEALELVIDTVRTSKHAWPFVDSVPDTVPGYYDLIEEPMDLKKLRTKIEFREYKSLLEIEKDFQLLVNNCEKFNGPRNTYTKMVYKLWKSFRKNIRLYLQRDLTMDEFETFMYPPARPPPKPSSSAPSPPEQSSAIPSPIEQASPMMSQELLSPILASPIPSPLEPPITIPFHPEPPPTTISTIEPLLPTKLSPLVPLHIISPSSVPNPQNQIMPIASCPKPSSPLNSPKLSSPLPSPKESHNTASALEQTLPKPPSPESVSSQQTFDQHAEFVSQCEPVLEILIDHESPSQPPCSVPDGCHGGP